MQVASLFSRDRETSLFLLELLGSLSLISVLACFSLSFSSFYLSDIFPSFYSIYVAKLSELLLEIEGILYAGNNNKNKMYLFDVSYNITVKIIDQFANDFRIIILLREYVKVYVNWML